MGAKLLILCASCALIAGCTKQAHKDTSAADKQQLGALFAAWEKAFEAKDVNGVMAVYATGNALTAYDLVPPLQYKGADAYRKDYADFFAQFAGPLKVETRDEHMEISGDLAVAYGLERISGKLKSGQPVDMWLRYTAAYKKIEGQWRDIHDHVSVPADMHTGKARLDLKP